MRINYKIIIPYEKRNLKIPKRKNVYTLVAFNIFINTEIEHDKWKTHFTSVIINQLSTK